MKVLKHVVPMSPLGSQAHCLITSGPCNGKICPPFTPCYESLQSHIFDCIKGNWDLSECELWFERTRTKREREIAHTDEENVNQCYRATLIPLRAQASSGCPGKAAGTPSATILPTSHQPLSRERLISSGGSWGEALLAVSLMAHLAKQ